MQTKFTNVSPGQIRPEGWFRRQLEIEAAGLFGNLDKIWPDVRDSAWIGGDRDSWERVPYWLDAFIPLAYLLDDEDLKARADRYVSGILERQRPDGWLCPCAAENVPQYDLWALFLIGKVLALYVSFTDDARAEDALMRAMKNLYTLLEDGTCHLRDWGKFRWFEALIPIEFLYRRHPEAWLLSLAARLREQGADYTALTDRWVTPLNTWRMETHIVNLCMMLKTEAVERALFGESRVNARTLESILRRYNGTAVGTYTGDECLAGISNVQGTELCAVGELMYSCEWLYRVTGDARWADQLEAVAFNAYPATFSDDMWAHQYLQMINQIECSRFPQKPIFRTNGGESHLFGLEPNYGCCTANGGQGWPKLALSSFLMEGENTVVLPVMLPATLRTCFGGTPVTISVRTEYPFRHHADYTVTADAPVRFAMKIRVPAWVTSVTVDGKPVPATGFVTLDRIWQGSETVSVAFDTEPRFVNRPHTMKVAAWGPLVFALPRRATWTAAEYTRDGVERKFPYCDYSLTSDDPWEFGFAAEDLIVCECPGDDIPFSSRHPRVVLQARLAPIDWRPADGYLDVSAPVPHSRTARGASVERELYPYGCAKLRVTEMPTAKQPKK